MHPIRLITLLLISWATPAFAAPTPEQLKFFESEVRPLLANHCYECHSAKAKKLKAGLRLDSLPGMLRGGESGAVLEPGNPDQSPLISAVRYEDNEMPPSGKLAVEDIATLEKWVAMGAPWPDEPESVVGAVVEEFDWQQRMTEHWCWQPVTPTSPPSVNNSSWPLSPIDHFILAKLEQAGLTPAADADKRTLIRRVYFDLIGLPPTPEQVNAFLADPSPKAYEHVVDELLRSPHFGEKWARHWLDLVRYGETLGHEFDYPLHHAYRYRDYVIRAFNADVPYDQFVHEHIAGDLIQPPRRHPTQAYNESIIGTGFWFLGEACHAPTDVKADEADRIDNQIDVMSKTFLGLTVACARCHDHKFDPIPTKDYYALAGYIQSSRRQEALLDPHGRIRDARRQLQELNGEREAVWQAAIPSLDVKAEVIRKELRAALESEEKETVEALKQPTHPFYALAKLQATEDFAAGRNELLSDLIARQRAAKDATDATELLIDFGEVGLEGWYVTGEAFDPNPTSTGSLQATGEEQPFARPGAVHSGRFGTQLQGVLRSPTFVLNHKRIHYKMNGENVTLRLIVDGYTMDEFNALLFADLLKKVDTKGQTQWISQTRDLYHYVGHRAHLEIIDHGDGYAAIEQIRFSDDGAPASSPHSLNFAALRNAPTDRDELLDGYVTAMTKLWQRFTAGRATGQDIEVVNWLVAHGAVEAPAAAAELQRRMAEMNSQTPAPLPVIALADGDAENEFVFIRGNHKNLSEEAPRRLLVALAGAQQPQDHLGSGRLELAQRITSASNPLTSRVAVNRLWHHLFGRGIVPTVDDFGKMGLPPSHPELLDWLADDFVNDKDWSIKRAIRQIVLSRTYRMSSLRAADPQRVRQVDPDNVLLHRAPVRRMTAEAIRDSLLMLSRRLDAKMYGPSVPVHLTAFMEGRGRPRGNGPVDGNGRRSVYIEVRRNFLSPMMLTFDRPSPFSSMGRRSNSNVPAQSLILMNDPFVIEQAHGWAKVLLEKHNNDEDRIEYAFQMAFAGPPSQAQAKRCRRFLKQVAAESRPAEEAWADLCHMLINMKSFIFLN